MITYGVMLTVTYTLSTLFLVRLNDTNNNNNFLFSLTSAVRGLQQWSHSLHEKIGPSACLDTKETHTVSLLTNRTRFSFSFFFPQRDVLPLPTSTAASLAHNPGTIPPPVITVTHRHNIKCQRVPAAFSAPFTFSLSLSHSLRAPMSSQSHTAVRGRLP